MKTASAKYLTIAAHIADAIQQGIYKAGHKVPSTRTICRQHHCSHMTAVHALLHLSGKGLIEARPRSGYFVCDDQTLAMITKKNLSTRPQVVVPDLSNLLEHLLSTENDPKFLPLGTAVRLRSLFPLKKILNSMPKQDRIFGLNAAYAFPPGSYALREQIARRLYLRGFKVTADDLILTLGATEATSLALRAITRPGDCVVASSPCFFGTLSMLQQLQLKIVEVPSFPHQGIDIDAVEKVLNRYPIKAGVFQPNFENPLGCLTPDASKKRLVRLFSERGIPLVEDDAYGELGYQGAPLSSLGNFDTKRQTIFSCGTFAKTLGPGFRTGWLVPPKEFLTTVSRLKLATTFSGSPMNEKLIEVFLRDHDYERHLHKISSEYLQGTQQVASWVAEFFPATTKLSNPLGGFSLWVELPSHIDSFQLYRQLIPYGIAISPGHIFSSAANYTNYMRLNCGYIGPDNQDTIKAAIATIGKVIRSHPP